MNNCQIHIDDYATALLSDSHFRNTEYRKYVDNCYLLQQIIGNINPDILNAVIHKAKWNWKIRGMLVDILSYVNGDSISDENFRMLLQFPRRQRNTYLEAIAHADLAFYQMEIINRVASSFEAFAWLFDRICENEFFQEEDMLQILRDASDITSYGIHSCIASAITKYGNSPKLTIAEIWIKETYKE